MRQAVGKAEILIIGVIFLSIFACWSLISILLLTINNIIWAYKGISTDNKSPSYKKRKRILKLVSIPLAFFAVQLAAVLIYAFSGR
jgi:hypothetical protein